MSLFVFGMCLFPQKTHNQFGSLTFFPMKSDKIIGRIKKHIQPMRMCEHFCYGTTTRGGRGGGRRGRRTRGTIKEGRKEGTKNRVRKEEEGGKKEERLDMNGRCEGTDNKVCERQVKRAWCVRLLHQSSGCGSSTEMRAVNAAARSAGDPAWGPAEHHQIPANTATPQDFTTPYEVNEMAGTTFNRTFFCGFALLCDSE